MVRIPPAPSARARARALSLSWRAPLSAPPPSDPGTTVPSVPRAPRMRSTSPPPPPPLLAAAMCSPRAPPPPRTGHAGAAREPLSPPTPHNRRTRSRAPCCRVMGWVVPVASPHPHIPQRGSPLTPQSSALPPWPHPLLEPCKPGGRAAVPNGTAELCGHAGGRAPHTPTGGGVGGGGAVTPSPPHRPTPNPRRAQRCGAPRCTPGPSAAIAV